MAYSAAAISATDLALLAADKPILGTQSIPVSPTSCIWHNSGSTTDRTSTTYPARRAYDGLPGYVTKPTTASEDHEWYYSMELAAAGVEFDFVAIVGHNFGTLHAGGALTITLEVDDADNFATAVSIPITVTTGASNTRIMKLMLDHVATTAKRYSAVQYARLKITRAATNFTPEIGELILGRRRQLKLNPVGEYDETSLHSTSENTATQGGVIYVYTFAAGARHLSASLVTHEDAYANDLIAFCSGTNYMTRSFVWVENPNSAPASWHLMVPDNPDFDFPTRGWTDRWFELEATEQGGEDCYLARGVY